MCTITDEIIFFADRINIANGERYYTVIPYHQNDLVSLIKFVTN